MKRSFSSQGRHDQKILQVAQRYLSMGYHVFADIRGWEAPEAVNGFRPDIVVIKGNNGLIIEVQTADSFRHDLPRLHAFRRFAELVRNVQFRLIML